MESNQSLKDSVNILPELDYVNYGRAGYVIFKDGQEELKLFYEFGAGSCIAIIYVPTQDEWVDKTSRPVSERLPILNFIAQQAIDDQAPGSYYKLEEDRIEIHEI